MIQFPRAMRDIIIRAELSQETRDAYAKRMAQLLRDPSFRARCKFLQTADYNAIRERLITGELYKTIAADYRVSTSRIASLATQLGLSRGKGANNRYVRAVDGPRFNIEDAAGFTKAA